MKKKHIKDDVFLITKIILKYGLWYLKFGLILWFVLLIIGTLKGDFGLTNIRFLYAFSGIILFLFFLLIYKILDKKYPDIKEWDIEKIKKDKNYKHWWQL